MVDVGPVDFCSVFEPTDSSDVLVGVALLVDDGLSLVFSEDVLVGLLSVLVDGDVKVGVVVEAGVVAEVGVEVEVGLSVGLSVDLSPFSVVLSSVGCGTMGSDDVLSVTVLSTDESFAFVSVAVAEEISPVPASTHTVDQSMRITDSQSSATSIGRLGIPTTCLCTRGTYLHTLTPP